MTVLSTVNATRCPPSSSSDCRSFAAKETVSPATSVRTSRMNNSTIPASPGVTVALPMKAVSRSPAIRAITAHSRRPRYARSRAPRRTCTTAAWPHLKMSSISIPRAAARIPALDPEIRPRNFTQEEKRALDRHSCNPSTEDCLKVIDETLAFGTNPLWIRRKRRAPLSR